jgi:hypothetical protein
MAGGNKGFLNQNRFKSGKALKQQLKIRKIKKDVNTMNDKRIFS